MKKEKEYICENCGCHHDGSYGSGRFCSIKCSHTYSSLIKRKEINEKLKKYGIIYSEKYRIKYNKNPKICPICGNIIPYELRDNKTCSIKCSRILSNLNNPHINDGGYREGSSRGHHGYYKGIWCDSTYELAYLIYCLDHNIDIKRCTESFDYIMNGKNHKYHPDFVVDGVIIEIKNYYREENDIKLNAINKEKKILYYEDLIPCFEYVSRTYNKKYRRKWNNFYELYD